MYSLLFAITEATLVPVLAREVLGRQVVAFDRSPAPNLKVNEAVQQALAACRNSVAPIVALALVIDDLHADAQWTDDEIREVENAARHILARIVR
jgi:hypothetical protein